MVNDENNATVVVDEDGGERFDIDFKPRRARADRRLVPLRARGARGRRRDAGLLDRARLDARPGQLPDGRRPRALGGRPERRVARGEAALRRRRLARPAHALGEPVADDHGARDAARRPPRRRPERVPRHRGGAAREGGAPRASTTARSSWSTGPSRSRRGRGTSWCASAAPGVCATDLHAIDGLMEPAGLTLAGRARPRERGLGARGRRRRHGRVGRRRRPRSTRRTAAGSASPCRRGLDMHCERHQFTGLTRTAASRSTCSSTSARWSRCPTASSRRTSRRTPTPGITAYHAVKRLAAAPRPRHDHGA